MNKRYIIGIAVIAICGVIGFTAFKGSLTPYVGFNEAKALDRPCQVMGDIDKENVNYDLEAGVLHFTIIDESGEELPVSYAGVKPGNFDQAMSVVCNGKFEDGTFHAERLLVKCPSKYQGLEEEGADNPHETDAPATIEDGV
ncbi:MAG: cytochrome c maturation protein CcmE [candidate division Zixibacteria bacterium]|nr:cytochrome c maturation protein CcmE [candidate division Zixibacteria bacterium]